MPDEILNGTDPFNPDSDNDNLLDGNETSFGTDPLDADTDDDGLNDGQEHQLGTDPLIRIPTTTVSMMASIIFL